MSDQHEGSCCAMCAWDYNGFCCCIPQRQDDNESVANLTKAEVSNPRQLHVIGKKSEVADRTLNERKYCAIDDYYYSEMFTCPICYGVERERERIAKILESLAQHDEEMCYFDGKLICYPEDCNAGVFAWTLQLILHERTNNPENGDAVIPETAKSARTHEI